jgi:hypothetical protein
MRLYNNATSMKDVRQMVSERLKRRRDGVLMHIEDWEQEQIDELPQFYFQGIALGIAYAHPDSGDTVGTVMIGGLRTVLNGHFTANTGQLMQWYFECEAQCYDANGERIWQGDDKLPDCIEDGMDKIKSHKSVTHTLSAQVLDRKKWHERESGNFPGYAGLSFFLSPPLSFSLLLFLFVSLSLNLLLTCFFFIAWHTGKTDVFFLKPYVRNTDGPECLLDRERICGVYISSARPFEQVDIKLQRQSA